jgi:hypothetical protein
MANHEIFICFSSKDEASAFDVVEFLEGQELKCWISSRDVRAGENYQEAIVRALEEARGIVFLFSTFSSQSDEIKKELSLGGACKVPVFPLRLSPIIPTGALRYELATRQWIDMFPNAEKALDKLAQTIHQALNRPATANDAEVGLGQARGDPIDDVAPVEIKQPPKKRIKKFRQPVLEANSEELEAVRALLARHVGPIARMLVQKASIEAGSLDNFCEQLADCISPPADRASFLQAARACCRSKANSA